MPQITPTAVGFNRLFGSKRPPIPATLTPSNHMRTLRAGEMLRWRADLLDGDASEFILDRTVDAAIDNDCLTGEIARLRRAGIGTEIADFVRLSHSLHWNGLGEELELFVECYA